MLSTAWILIYFVFLEVTLLLLVLGFNSRKRYKAIKHEYLKEITQSSFAEARFELIKGVFESKIDPNSRSFKLLYKLNTAFMRNTDRYHELNKDLTEFILTSKEDLAESRSSKAPLEMNNSEIEKNINLTIRALGNFIIDYSFPLKALYKIISTTNATFQPEFFLTLPFISQKEKEKIEAKKNFFEVRKVLMSRDAYQKSREPFLA